MADETRDVITSLYNTLFRSVSSQVKKNIYSSEPDGIIAKDLLYADCGHC